MPPTGRRPLSARRSPTRPKLPTDFREVRLPADDLVDEALLAGLRYDRAELSGRRAALLDIEECTFADSDLSGARLDKVTVIDTLLTRCDLANLHLEQGSLSRVRLEGCRATGLVASGLLLRHTSFRDCIVDFGAFRFARFETVEFVDCRLHGADFVSADISGATFRRCDLTRAELSQANARGALFVDCSWDEVRGVTSLAGATVAQSTALDSEAFMVALAGSAGIILGDPAAFPEPPT